MSSNDSCKDCKAHGRLDEKVLSLEGSVKKLWDKWDWLTKTVVGFFVMLSINLGVGILLIIRTWPVK